MKYTVIVMMCLAAVLTACKDDNISLGQCTGGSAAYPFLAAGHEMHYVYSDLSADDSMLIKIDLHPDSSTFHSRISFEPSGTVNDLYYHTCGQDLYLSTNGDFSQYAHWWFSLDEEPGGIWTRSSAGNLYTYHLFAKNVTVTTPMLGRTFTNCRMFTYHSSTNFVTDTIYFKPDMGIVYYKGPELQYELSYENF